MYTSTFLFLYSMAPLSGYILTLNSEEFLDKILSKMLLVCDELFILDSGSNDNTIAIAEKNKATIINHPFLNFVDQRNFALSICKHSYVFFMDCDEVPSDGMIQAIQKLKEQNFGSDKYRFKSLLQVLGKPIQGGIYPACNGDYCERLICSDTISYSQHFLVHEELTQHKSRVDIDASYTHFTFQTKIEFKEKLEKYTSLAAIHMYEKKKKVNWFKIHVNPIAAWIKWYLIKKSFLDGSIGWTCGKYAYHYTQLKYKKLKEKYRLDN